MIRSVLALLILASSILAMGCSGTDSAAPDTGDDQDVTSSSGTAFFVAAGAQPAGAINVKIANRATTACADGAKKDACPAQFVDYSALKLDAAGTAKLDKAVHAGHAVLQGKLVTKSPQLGSPASGPELRVSAAWVGAAGKDPAEFDSFFRLSNMVLNGVCVNGGNCARQREQLLNKTTAPITIPTADLSRIGASTKELAAADTQLAIGGPGLLAVGINHTLVSAVVGQGVTNTSTFAVTDFYLPVTSGKAKDGELCETAADCETGLSCKSNCPPGAMCIAAITECTK